MSKLLEVARSAKLLTFDCYGTLIDWETGIRMALQEVLAWDEAYFDRYLEREAYYEALPYRRYKEILTAVEFELVQQAGGTRVSEPKLAASVGQWQPFPDTVEALRRLKRRYRLGVLSNVDRDMFAQTALRLEVVFAWVLTAEDVGSYKPAHAHFQRIQALSGFDRAQILHVAQSLYHDVAPCAELKIPCVWINRRHQPHGEHAPLAEFGDLASFAEAIL